VRDAALIIQVALALHQLVLHAAQGGLGQPGQGGAAAPAGRGGGGAPGSGGGGGGGCGRAGAGAAAAAGLLLGGHGCRPGVGAGV